ncbi:MAG: type II toxin-antitoxin system ParD family antitoxin [Methylococcales bacterium]|jgi:antitoxin ParD1/3/4|nr:type II toxin-antitoxin system ParD family antitoxin [Methylococcales bacterium]MBT7408400.1 type II toxin-antitoxin system ParD family antitoxin [Methylococcales bacterium]
MSTIRKTITLTDQQGAWIKDRINEGYFTNDSEYLRDLIRRDQERHSDIERIRQALIQGEQSGMSDRSPDDIIQAVIKRQQTSGEL